MEAERGTVRDAARLLPDIPVAAMDDHALVPDRHEPLAARRHAAERGRRSAVAGPCPAVPVAAVHDRPAVSDRHEAVAAPGDAGQPVSIGVITGRLPADAAGAVQDGRMPPDRDESTGAPGDVAERVSDGVLPAPPARAHRHCCAESCRLLQLRRGARRPVRPRNSSGRTSAAALSSATSHATPSALCRITPSNPTETKRVPLQTTS